MIKIEIPQVESDQTFATLSTFITIDDKRDKVWFRVEKSLKNTFAMSVAMHL